MLTTNLIQPSSAVPISPAIPLVVVLGPTAAGKSALAITLAQRFHGEIISADAFAVYRGMDIGTAKPSVEERADIPHHLIDWLEPEQSCNAQQWFNAADAALHDIHARGKLPIIAGGTPLYVKLLLEGISSGAPRDAAIRTQLQQRYLHEGGAVLYAELQRIDPVYAADRHPNDERRIVRALEVATITGQPYSSFHTTDGIRRTDLRPLLLGLEWERSVLYQRINTRTQTMFDLGLVDEVRALRPRLSPEAAQAVGYKEVIDHLDRQYDLATAIERTAQHSRNLAKHQLTWYRKFNDITWLPGDHPTVMERAWEVCQSIDRSGDGDRLHAPEML